MQRQVDTLQHEGSGGHLQPPENRTFYLGTSGWAHRDWVGKLYPHDLSAAEYLTAYARHFDTVEIEHTWFETPSREMVRSWHHRTPETFRFSPCAPRQITHVQRLRHTQGLLEDFLAVMRELGDKLGPILLQLPDDFRLSEQEHLEAFLQTLPREVQFAVEFHHGSWLKDTTFELLEAYQIAWVVVDAAFLPRLPRVTAPFAYVRWHGYPGVEARTRRQTDPLTALRPWVPILRQLAQQATPVYGYVRESFSDDAPRACQILRDLLGTR
jgi:uncharacterized protein YecE (DUF72 family)